MTFWCQAGDLLFYGDAKTLETRAIQFGEELEDGPEAFVPYHVAIALGSYDKLEADGKDTTINPIDYGRFVVCRPPYDPRKLPTALIWGRKQVGKLYGWIGIFDQVLRMLSGSRLHLPRRTVEWADRHWPYCSTLAAAVIIKAGYYGILPWPAPTPAEMYRAVKDYKVKV